MNAYDRERVFEQLQVQNAVIRMLNPKLHPEIFTTAADESESIMNDKYAELISDAVFGYALLSVVPNLPTTHIVIPEELRAEFDKENLHDE